MSTRISPAGSARIPDAITTVNISTAGVAAPTPTAQTSRRHTLGGRVRGSRLVTRLITAIAAVAACLTLFAGAASADEFSPYSGTGVHTYYSQFGDTCWLAVGPVYDKNGTQGSFAVIGGVTVQGCSRRHSFEAYVYEEYASSKTGPWHSVAGSERQMWLQNVYGFGTCGSGCPSGTILETPHICNGPALYWATVAIVDEYDANGNFVREVAHTSDVPSAAVQAKPSPC